MRHLHLASFLVPAVLYFAVGCGSPPADPSPEAANGGAGGSTNATAGSGGSADPPAADAGTAEAGEPTAEQRAAILANYALEAAAFQRGHDLTDDWRKWVLDHEDGYANAYVRARWHPAVRLAVRYDQVVPMNPPWKDEAEHMAALKRMAELQYPGWTFDFGTDPAASDATVVLAYSGSLSNAGGETISLIWEGIFAHEFGHVLGLWHHYCADATDPCDQVPPGEGPCIMSASSVCWGFTERFVLKLDDVCEAEAINAAIDNLNSRYPKGYPNSY